MGMVIADMLFKGMLKVIFAFSLGLCCAAILAFIGYVSNQF